MGWPILQYLVIILGNIFLLVVETDSPQLLFIIRSMDSMTSY